MLILGPILIILGLLFTSLGWQNRNAPPAPPEPRTGDIRIVKDTDGRFTVEVFWEHPRWYPLGTDTKHDTLEAAQAVVTRWKSKPEVVSATK